MIDPIRSYPQILKELKKNQNGDKTSSTREIVICPLYVIVFKL
jgi:hypothetical protein